MKAFWVYILASKGGGRRRATGRFMERGHERPRSPCLRAPLWRGTVQGFTKKHDVKLLVYYEQHDTVALAAIQREKNIKHWSRR